MNLLEFIPFFYFQQTRLNSATAFVFHSAYEWLPAFLIIALFRPSAPADFYLLGLYYLAFISLYEIGYAVNDQLAFKQADQRLRAERWSGFQLFIFIFIRLIVFVSISVFTGNQYSWFWWSWYAALTSAFTLHNYLKDRLLKCVSFIALAFARFFSPLIILADQNLMLILLAPVVLNYVFYRLITYMDSKGLLISVDRKSSRFRIGFYMLLIPLSCLLSVLSGSLIPIGVNIYYFIVNLFSRFFERSETTT